MSGPSIEYNCYQRMCSIIGSLGMNAHGISSFNWLLCCLFRDAVVFDTWPDILPIFGWKKIIYVLRTQSYYVIVCTHLYETVTKNLFGWIYHFVIHGQHSGLVHHYNSLFENNIVTWSAKNLLQQWNCHRQPCDFTIKFWCEFKACYSWKYKFCVRNA